MGKTSIRIICQVVHQDGIRHSAFINVLYAPDKISRVLKYPIEVPWIYGEFPTGTTLDIDLGFTGERIHLGKIRKYSSCLLSFEYANTILAKEWEKLDDTKEFYYIYQRDVRENVFYFSC